MTQTQWYLPRGPIFPQKEEIVSDEPILQFFDFAHLPVHLKPISAQFANLATWVVMELPRNPERTVALRKLLEAKDAAVRAAIHK